MLEYWVLKKLHLVVFREILDAGFRTLTIHNPTT
ncbi:hypothetical protein OGM63_02365 [Plectonema radiosum NIES-515]|uniref:Uncharacterized protein n=1 Tax=Plectonema radiosum NIES-515 TaxID=2986073 RepID=A0ABT3ATD4_9CYAN|nr:hypothetical protein [Plectonema radiosum NIES-515]